MRDIFTKLWKLADLQKKKRCKRTVQCRNTTQDNKMKGTTISPKTFYMIVTVQDGSHTHHLDLSFSLGGWKLLLDINISALKRSFKISQAEKCLSDWPLSL